MDIEINDNLIPPSLPEPFQEHFQKWEDDFLEMDKPEKLSDKLAYIAENDKSVLTVGG